MHATNLFNLLFFRQSLMDGGTFRDTGGDDNLYQACEACTVTVGHHLIHNREVRFISDILNNNHTHETADAFHGRPTDSCKVLKF